MGRRVQTGCNNCKRCTNSGAAEFGRKQGKLWANLATMGGVAAVQAFTAGCRGCGHKMSLHDTGSTPQGNSYATPVAVQPQYVPLEPPQQIDPPAPQHYTPPAPPRPVAPPPPPQVPAGWYPDPDGMPCSRWWDGARWTSSTAPR